MAVETLGEALAYGWRISALCAWGKQREGLQSKRECVYGAELDLATLVWTRGRAFRGLQCPWSTQLTFGRNGTQTSAASSKCQRLSRASSVEYPPGTTTPAAPMVLSPSENA
jgi:hypothetical protein